ncbi:dipeptidase [Nannocystis sp. ncelm1]|uniref:Dipeptidase n=1 Tax=Nannocystis radixulma TaxID=2995305 RepID=A0ABT5BD87_9BACT|nr:dipeptidase [Nannocystis radixulma]MDC0672091.1 dipeptidase [Nannocystis radixulma]
MNSGQGKFAGARASLLALGVGIVAVGCGQSQAPAAVAAQATPTPVSTAGAQPTPTPASTLAPRAAEAPATDPALAADPALQRAHAVLARVPLIDGHNDLPWTIREDKQAPGDVAAYDLRAATTGHTDLPRLRAGKLGAQFWSVYVPGDRPAGDMVRLQLEQIDLARRIIAQYPDDLALAGTADEVEQVFRSGRIASLLGAEGGHTLANSLGTLRAYYALGVRYLTLTHNVHTDWADCAVLPPRHAGLTPFGEEVVREMNRLGMLVDLSHVSPATMDDALRVSEAPVIFSHSSARAITDVARNVPDDILKRVAENDGIVMVTFLPAYVSIAANEAREARRKARAEAAKIADPEARARRQAELDAQPQPRATLAQVADHVEHVRRVAGVDHVGLGSDFDGMGAVPVGLEDVSRYPYLLAELARRGWTDEELEKLAGRNLLRVLRAAEAVAKQLQQTRPPSLATFSPGDVKP